MDIELFEDRAQNLRIYASSLFPQAKDLYLEGKLFPVYAHIDTVKQELPRYTMILLYGNEKGRIMSKAHMQFENTAVIDIMKHDFDIENILSLAGKDVTGYIANPGRDIFAGFSKELSFDAMERMRKQFWDRMLAK